MVSLSHSLARRFECMLTTLAASCLGIIGTVSILSLVSDPSVYKACADRTQSSFYIWLGNNSGAKFLQDHLSVFECPYGLLDDKTQLLFRLTDWLLVDRRGRNNTRNMDSLIPNHQLFSWRWGNVHWRLDPRFNSYYYASILQSRMEEERRGDLSRIPPLGAIFIFLLCFALPASSPSLKSSVWNLSHWTDVVDRPVLLSSLSSLDNLYFVLLLFRVLFRGSRGLSWDWWGRGHACDMHIGCIVLSGMAVRILENS